MGHRIVRLCLAAVAVCLAVSWSASAQTIGPDARGYVMSKAGAGSFSSIVGQAGTVRRTNAPGGAAQDDAFFNVPIGFSFPYYGTNYTNSFVSTNGFMSFGGDTGAGSSLNPNLALATITGGGIGAPTVERPVIALYWDDLLFTNSVAIPGGLFTLTRTVGPRQEFVVEYNGVQYFGADTFAATFQAIVRDDGSMQFNYPNTTGPPGSNDGASASVGLHDANGGGAANRFLSWNFNGVPFLVTSGTTLNVVAVPEPTSILLFGGSAVAAALSGRRFRRRPA